MRHIYACGNNHQLYEFWDYCLQKYMECDKFSCIFDDLCVIIETVKG